MILLVDLGNSAIKWALTDGHQLNMPGRFEHAGKLRAADLSDHWHGMESPEAVIVGSVAGDDNNAILAQSVQQLWSLDVQSVATEAKAYGVVNSYAEPAHLGVDRWLALVGAWHLFGEAACIVDCGTAITVDGIDGNGRHLGGAIAPGSALMRGALQSRSPGIFDTESSELTFPALDTGPAVHAGSLFAAAGFVELAAERLRGQLGSTVRCIITGGGAGDIQPLLNGDWDAIPDLVIQGLAVTMTKL